MNLLEFVKSVDKIAPVLPDAPDKNNRPKGDFMLVGCIVKITKPTRKRIHGKFKNTEFETKRIIYVDLMDRNGRLSMKVYRIIVLLESFCSEAEKKFFRVHDLIALKNPDAPYGRLLHYLSITYQKNYWLFRKEDQPVALEDQVFGSTCATNQNIDEIAIIEEKSLLKGEGSMGCFTPQMEISPCDCSTPSVIRWIDSDGRFVLSMNKHLHKCSQSNVQLPGKSPQTSAYKRYSTKKKLSRAIKERSLTETSTNKPILNEDVEIISSEEESIARKEIFEPNSVASDPVFSSGSSEASKSFASEMDKICCNKINMLPKKRMYKFDYIPGRSCELEYPPKKKTCNVSTQAFRNLEPSIMGDGPSSESSHFVKDASGLFLNNTSETNLTSVAVQSDVPLPGKSPQTSTYQRYCIKEKLSHAIKEGSLTETPSTNKPILNEDVVGIFSSEEESIECNENVEPESVASNSDFTSNFSEASKSFASNMDMELQEDKVLRLLLDNAIDFTTDTCSQFYSFGQFSKDSIAHMVSDRLVLGYCKDGCKMVFNYYKFCWKTSEDNSKHFAFCPACGLEYIMKVFFYCPLKLISDPHPIDSYFYSDSSHNIFGIDPVDYAYSDLVRGMFRIDVALFLKGNDRFTGFDFHKIGDVLIPFFFEFLNQPFKKQLV